jgi:transglutaminase-like putative cysteine protease
MRVRLTVIAAVATLFSSIGLYPLFESSGWVWSGLGAIVAVAAGGVLARRLRLSAPVHLLAGIGALCLYVTVRYTAGQALLGVVPTPASLARLSDLVDEGWRAANRYAAPVPLGPGIELLSTLGIGAVAALVDLLAVRLRRAAPAGLPLLALYSVPAAIRDDSVSWLAFALGAGGFLALLLADAREQVIGWGRPVFTRRWAGPRAPGPAAAEWAGPRPPAQRALPDSAALNAAGRRIGVAAVAIAVAVPTVLPGIRPDGLLGLGGKGGGGGGGSQTLTTPDPLVSLKRELASQSDAEVLTYTTDDPSPDYLRMYALDLFDGQRWTHSKWESEPRHRIGGKPLPPAPGLSLPGTTVTTQMRVSDKVRAMTFLPLPYPPTEVSARGDWRVHEPSLMVFSPDDEAGGRSFTVKSLRVKPTADQLETAGIQPPSSLRPYTTVPQILPRQVHDLVERITGAEGADTAYERAMRLQRYFTQPGRFTYDTSTPQPRRASDLVAFLIEDQRGYCEQFAAAMALMARMADIPARVAVGYTPGVREANGKWVVRSRDAHAWPELYFEGAGWVRFEPTPAGSLGQGTAVVPEHARPRAASTASRSPGATPSASATTSAPAPSSTPSAAAGQRPDRTDPGAGTGAPEESGWDLPAGRLAGAGLVLMILMAPMIARLLGRRRRWKALVPAGAARMRDPGGGPPAVDPARAAHAAWQEMRADAIDHGLSWRSSDSPRAAAHRLSELVELGPDAGAALQRLAKAEERARYARTPDTVQTLRTDVRTVRDAFAGAVDRRTRWRARLAPPSTLASLRGTGARALDAFDRLDVLSARLRARLRR